MLGEYLRINNDKQYVDKDKLKKLVNNFLDNLPIKAIIGKEVDKEMKKRKKLI